MATAAVQATGSKPAKYAIDCQLDYSLDSTCDFVFMIHPAQTPRQRLLRESLTLSPALPSRLHVDRLGNRLLRLQAPAGPLVIDYTAQVELGPLPQMLHAREVPIAELPDAVLADLLPSRYCESDRLGAAARQLFGALEPGQPRVRAICDWIGRNIEYRIGSSHSTTTALDVFVQRAGVCRDFAHLGISFCRSLNIPARLVCGYTQFEEPPPDFHAVFEAYLGGQWVLFDATGLSPVDSLLRIAHGRDAKDVAFATIYGAARMNAMSPQVHKLAETRAGDVRRREALAA